MSSRVLRNALLSSALVGFMSIPAANAAQVTDTFQVTATVEAECEVSATDLLFGTIDLQNGNSSHTLKKREAIVKAVNARYLKRTHKFGIRLPKTVKEALEIDKENGNTMWAD